MLNNHTIKIYLNYNNTRIKQRIRLNSTKKLQHNNTKYEKIIKSQTKLDLNSSKEEKLESGLYIVSTPIGNLGDITLRAIKILERVDKIYSEDTRHTIKLLNYYNIKNKLESCHAYNEINKLNKIISLIDQNQSIALVSDAGTPAISDPGNKLITELIKRNIKIIPIPGPSAVITSLIASGLNISSFTFIGFLPIKSRMRKKKIKMYSQIPSTLIIFVSPNDIIEVLKDCGEILGYEKLCCLAREMTKIYENYNRGTIEEVINELNRNKEEIRGEMTLLIEGEYQRIVEITDEMILNEIKESEEETSSVSKLSKEISNKLNIKKSRVYKLILKKNNST